MWKGASCNEGNVGKGLTVRLLEALVYSQVCFQVSLSVNIIATCPPCVCCFIVASYQQLRIVETGNCTSSGRILDLWAAGGFFTCCLLQDAFIFTVISYNNIKQAITAPSLFLLKTCYLINRHRLLQLFF